MSPLKTSFIVLFEKREIMTHQHDKKNLYSNLSRLIVGFSSLYFNLFYS